MLLVVILGVAIFATLNWPACWSGGRNALYPAGAAAPAATAPPAPEIFEAVTAQGLVAQQQMGDELSAVKITGFPGFMPINQAISTEAAALAGFELMAGSLINNPEELVDVRGVAEFAVPGPGATGQFGATRKPAKSVASKYRKAASGHRVKSHHQDTAKDKPPSRFVGNTGPHHMAMDRMAHAAKTGTVPFILPYSTSAASAASDATGFLPKTHGLGHAANHPNAAESHVARAYDAQRQVAAGATNDGRKPPAPVALIK